MLPRTKLFENLVYQTKRIHQYVNRETGLLQNKMKLLTSYYSQIVAKKTDSPRALPTPLPKP